ncbi:hypothetical protein [Rubritalea tangerina]|uniref:Zinc-finger domain-containing protein n=1 Tax=Rubritalea tangerina TaxID=430798 RepID=A0ABW4ZBV2_9BACT
MKLSKDDPRLTAYAFGELDAQETREVAQALRSQPDLQKVVDELLAIEALFKNEQEEQYRLRPEQRAAIFQASEVPQNVVHIPKRSWNRGVVAVLASAAAVVLTLTVLQRPAATDEEALAVMDWEQWSDLELTGRTQASSQSWEQVAEPSADSSVDVKKDLTQAMRLHASSLHEEVERRAESGGLAAPKQLETVRGWREPVGGDAVRVPLSAGNASMAWVRKALLEKVMPEPAVVRAEELLNERPLSQEVDLQVGALGVSVEVVRSPWSDGELLVFIDFIGREACDAEAALVFDEVVKFYKLVGYGGEGDNEAPAGRRFEAQSGHKVAYRIRPEAGIAEDAGLGDLKLRVAEQSGQLKVRGSAKSWQELSNPRKLDVAVLTWAYWLENPSDTEMRALLEKQIAESDAVDAPELVDAMAASLRLGQ